MVGPPFFPDPKDRGPGAVPLVGSKGEALAGFGAAPQGLLSLTRLPCRGDGPILTVRRTTPYSWPPLAVPALVICPAGLRRG